MLTGPLGLGHEMMARGCGRLLERSGWEVRRLDSMSLLGSWRGDIGRRLFTRAVAVPGLYDGLHFAHLRTGSGIADRIDRASNARLVPALRAELDRHPADLVFSVFATGGSAAGRLKAERPGLRTVVMCTDVSVHRIWAAEGTDLFLVTSAAAEASVRRYQPWAQVAVVPPPIRPDFYAAPSQRQAREALGLPDGPFCALVIDSGWGFGPLVGAVSGLAAAGVHVLAVAGRDRRIERRLRELAAGTPLITPFGFTDRVPELMAAADAIVALPGAVTCGEARVVGRHVLLLDVMPGHGRDNLQHELELGHADVAVPTADGVTASVLALRDRAVGPYPSQVPRWEPAYAAALRGIGLDLHSWKEPSAHVAHAVSESAVV
jgi:UDP-N-acetylglucosamine:LPS N-acetylglucosamine transferase